MIIFCRNKQSKQSDGICKLLFILAVEYFSELSFHALSCVLSVFVSFFFLSDPNSNPDLLSLSLPLIFSYFYLNSLLNLGLKTNFWKEIYILFKLN